MLIITGTGFMGATAVDFGSTAARTFTVNSSTQITATDAAGSGTVAITVATPGGTSATSAADQFTYTSSASTVVTLATPDNGSTPGTLRYVLANAPSGSTVTFASTLSGDTITLSSVLDITSNVAIMGLGAANLAISGGNTAEVFNVASGVTANINSLTVENGKITGNGGGITNSGTLTLNNDTVTGNSASGSGGGIYNASGGTAILSNDSISGNSAAGGADVGNASGAQLVAGGAGAFTSTTNVNNNGTLNLAGYSVSTGSLTGSGTITNNLVEYQIDNGVAQQPFNDTLGTETTSNQAEDNWMGNVFTAAAGGTQLQSITFVTSSINFSGTSTGLNSGNLPNPNITAALYTGSPATGLSLVPGSVNTVPLNVPTGLQYVTVPFASLQYVPAGQVFTAALLVDDVAGNIGIWTEDSSNSNANSYYDVDNPIGDVNTYNIAAPNDPTLNGNTYPGQPAGTSNAYADTTLLRVNEITPAATLTVSGGGSYSGTIQNGSGTVALTVAGTSQTLTLTGTDTYSGATTINSTDTLQAGSATALSSSSNVANAGTLNLGGYSNSIGTLSGNGTVTNNLVTYQIDNGVTQQPFNDTLYSEAEDNWNANVFTAAAGGTQLQSITFVTESINFSGASTGLNSGNLPNPNITAALYLGSPATGMTLVPGSVNTVPLNVPTGLQYVTVPLAAPQNIAAGQVFTAALLVDDVPNNIGVWLEDNSGSNANSYFDDDAGVPSGTVNTYNIASPNDPTPNGDNWGSSGSTNAYADTTLLRVNDFASAATLTVTGGGSYSGTIQNGNGTLALTVAGTSQTLTLSGTNTYSGQTTINGTDTLLVNGSETSGVTVSSGGTLGGTGTAGAVTVSGTVNPGSPVSSTGTLAASSANFSSGGNLTVQITAGSNDLLNLGSGALTLGGTSTLTLDLNGLTMASGGSPITIVSDGSQSGHFSAVNVINNPHGFHDSVSYTGISRDRHAGSRPDGDKREPVRRRGNGRHQRDYHRHRLHGSHGGGLRQHGGHDFHGEFVHADHRHRPGRHRYGQRHRRCPRRRHLGHVQRRPVQLRRCPDGGGPEPDLRPGDRRHQGGNHRLRLYRGHGGGFRQHGRHDLHDQLGHADHRHRPGRIAGSGQCHRCRPVRRHVGHVERRRLHLRHDHSHRGVARQRQRARHPALCPGQLAGRVHDHLRQQPERGYHRPDQRAQHQQKFHDRGVGGREPGRQRQQCGSGLQHCRRSDGHDFRPDHRGRQCPGPGRQRRRRRQQRYADIEQRRRVRQHVWRR